VSACGSVCGSAWVMRHALFLRWRSKPGRVCLLRLSPSQVSVPLYLFNAGVNRDGFTYYV